MSTDNDAWMFQASMKLDAHMYNIRGNTATEFVENIEAFEERAIPAILSAQQKLSGGGAVAAVVPISGGAPVEATKPVETNGTWSQPTSQSVEKPKCQHGQRIGREGNGAKGPWRAYFCPTAKGTPDQCDPVWVDRKDGAAWNSWAAG
jgi:hypothetical protein